MADTSITLGIFQYGLAAIEAGKTAIVNEPFRGTGKAPATREQIMFGEDQDLARDKNAVILKSFSTGEAQCLW